MVAIKKKCSWKKFLLVFQHPSPPIYRFWILLIIWVGIRKIIQFSNTVVVVIVYRWNFNYKWNLFGPHMIGWENKYHKIWSKILIFGIFLSILSKWRLWFSSYFYNNSALSFFPNKSIQTYRFTLSNLCDY